MLRRGRAKRIPLSVMAEAWLVVLALLGAVWLVRSDVLANIVEWTAAWGPASGLFVGLLYSTFITTPLAIGGFIELTGTMPVWQIALSGALGATLVDLVLIDGMRSPLAMLLVRGVAGRTGSFVKRFARVRNRWVAAFFGALLIAIPLPTDELGLAIIGASHLRPLALAPIIFAADFVGIYSIVSAVQYFS